VLDRKGEKMKAERATPDTKVSHLGGRMFFVLVLALACAASVLPGSAHPGKTVKGTIAGTAVSIEAQYSADWGQFVAGGCKDVTTAAQAAFVDVQAQRGHRATIKVTGSATGAVGDRSIQVTVGTINCQDPTRWTTPWGVRPVVTANRQLTFIIPSNAYVIALLGKSDAALGQTFEVAITHV
jgi:hypothetical protein